MRLYSTLRERTDQLIALDQEYPEAPSIYKLTEYHDKFSHLSRFNQRLTFSHNLMPTRSVKSRIKHTTKTKHVLS